MYLESGQQKVRASLRNQTFNVLEQMVNSSLYGWDDNKIDLPLRKMKKKGFADLMDLKDKANKWDPEWNLVNSIYYCSSLYTTVGKKVKIGVSTLLAFLRKKKVPFELAHVLFSVWEFYACPYHLLQKMSGCKAKFVAFFYKKDNSSIDSSRSCGPSRQLLLLKFMYWPSFLLTLSYLLCMQKATVTWYAAHLAASFSRCYS